MLSPPKPDYTHTHTHTLNTVGLQHMSKSQRLCSDTILGWAGLPSITVKFVLVTLSSAGASILEPWDLRWPNDLTLLCSEPAMRRGIGNGESGVLTVPTGHLCCLQLHISAWDRPQQSHREARALPIQVSESPPPRESAQCS